MLKSGWKYGGLLKKWLKRLYPNPMRKVKGNKIEILPFALFLKAGSRLFIK